MQAISTRIGASEKLTSLLGSWPAFHDAEILKVELDRGIDPKAAKANATFHIRYMDKQNDLLVRLQFLQVEDLKLEDFNNQNVIFEMRIVEDSDGKRTRVEIATSYGLRGSFMCNRVEVLSVSRLPRE